MGQTLAYHRMTDFSPNHPHENFYQLDTEGGLFGYFYVGFDGEGSGVSTLIWQGNIQNTLDSEVFESLPSKIDPRWTENMPFSSLDTRIVTFIINERDLEKYNLNDPECYSKYQEALRNVNEISFARFDINKVSKPVPLAYSFTAENPRFSSTNRGELTVLLPKTQPWTTSLLEWVIERKSEAKDIDLQNGVSTLTMLTEFS